MIERLAPDARVATLLDAAVDLAESGHYLTVTADALADAAGVAKSLVFKYFRSMADLRVAIMAEAVERRIPRIVAQGLIAGDETARTAPAMLRRKALEAVEKGSL